MRVAIYTRVSTKEQSCEIQLQELNLYAKERGFAVVATYVDSVTGDFSKRKAKTRYDELMDDARAGRFDCVLVWKYDRFARSLLGLITSVAEFERLGIQFISRSENIDTTTPTGKLFFHIMASFAEFERSLIVERTKRGLKLIQDTGRNSKGELVTLGRPEIVSQDKKDAVVELYMLGKGFQRISETVGMPLGTVYSIVKRSVLPCAHGKYRCSHCRSLGRVPIRIDATDSSDGLGGHAC